MVPYESRTARAKFLSQPRMEWYIHFTIMTVHFPLPITGSFIDKIIIYSILLYRHECFTGKYTTRKIHKNYIRDPSGLFPII